MRFDLIPTIILFTVLGLAAIGYSLRVFMKGRAQFDRVDRQGGSPLLSKRIMEMGYWFLQPFGRLLVFFHVKPNHISWACFTFSLIAGVCLAFGHFGSAAVFAAISGLFDALDGMVARMTKSVSGAGEVLDSSIDRYAEFFFLAGLIIHYRQIPVVMIIALFALIGSFMVSYSTAKAQAVNVTPPRGSMRRSERAVYLTLGAALCPVTIPWLEAIREYPVALGHPMVVALTLVAVLANVSAVERLLEIARMTRVREAAQRHNLPDEVAEESTRHRDAHT